MIISIHQPNYLPWLGYFDKIQASDVFILFDDVQFQKNEFQNRNRIRNAQSAQWLTVPIFHNLGQKINEVKINNTVNWRKDHLNGIELNYKKTPYFNDYIGPLREVYQKDWDSLAELNIALISVLVQMLGITTKLVRSSLSQVNETDSTLRLIELCRKYEGTRYISGIDGPDYLDMKKFDDNGIEVIVQDYQHPQYNQVWMKKGGEFISCLSVIDLLFNCGKESLGILSRINA